MTQHSEFAEVVNLQRAVWRFDDLELLPVRFFVVADKIGGQILGAFQAGRMVGFCLAIPGLKPEGVCYLHSHMLGVLAEYRDTGVGRKLKLAQRDDALARGIDLIEWTFDPLEIKNAYFNLVRLGAVVRRFVPNQYGSTTSPLHGGLPTDRCIAEWTLRSSRVEAALAGKPETTSNPAARIEVPAAIEALKKTNPVRALDIQTRVRGEFLQYFAGGLAATSFERTRGAGFYVLSRLD
ncbi:MAG TPA: GNAT family N-acetyltransferase [Bryobacteraceae bacterium]|nr:GNAT family N-acetyltransferase [Bryobacteraceae bacterium]